VQRLEDLVDDGLSPIGRHALMVDVQNLLNELVLVKELSDLPTGNRFEALEERLRKLERRLQNSRRERQN
jgi:hypothetical protein